MRTKQCILLGVFVLGFTTFSFAKDPSGEVVGTKGDAIIVSLPSSSGVSTGDRVEITWVTPDGDLLSVGTGTVREVSGNSVTVSLTSGQGSVTVGMRAKVSKGALSPARTEMKRKAVEGKRDIETTSVSKGSDDFDYSDKKLSPQPTPEELYAQYESMQYDSKKKDKARLTLMAAAEKGYLRAQVQLGYLLFTEAYGQRSANAARDAIRYLKWAYNENANSEDPDTRALVAKAAFYLGQVYDAVEETADEKEAVKWYRTALTYKELDEHRKKTSEKQICFKTKPLRIMCW